MSLELQGACEYLRAFSARLVGFAAQVDTLLARLADCDDIIDAFDQPARQPAGALRGGARDGAPEALVLGHGAFVSRDRVERLAAGLFAAISRECPAPPGPSDAFDWNRILRAVTGQPHTPQAATLRTDGAVRKAAAPVKAKPLVPDSPGRVNRPAGTRGQASKKQTTPGAGVTSRPRPTGRPPSAEVAAKHAETDAAVLRVLASVAAGPHPTVGCRAKWLAGALKMPYGTVKDSLKRLRRDKHVRLVGSRTAARWFATKPAPVASSRTVLKAPVTRPGATEPETVWNGALERSGAAPSLLGSREQRR